VRTVIPPKIKQVLRFVQHYSNTLFYGGWVYLPNFTAKQYGDFRLNIIRDYVYFRKAERLGLIRMQYNESGAVLTLQGKKVLEGV